MTIDEWIGTENEIGIDIWNKKYKYENESFDEWIDRISNGDEELKQIIIEKKFLFGGRILSNRGLNKKGQKVTMSNCYVITPAKDSIESIFECASKLARTYSYGGGCGIDISNLAPRGAKVNNTARETTGSVSFMDLYSLVTGLIGQRGRRGALMISLNCNHPDLEEFIEIKSDLNKVTKANISVKITNDFLDAVKNNEDYELSFIREETGEKISKVINARKVFKKLAEQNWRTAEPGILLWDNITNWNLLSNNDEFEYAGVNPCVSGDSLVQTTEGVIQIRDLVGKTPYVYCMDDNGCLTISKATKVWKTRKNAKVVKIKTGKGELICTPDHLIFTTNKGWVNARELKKGDKIKGLNRSMAGEKYVGVALSGTPYIKEHRFVYSYFDSEINGYDIHHKNGDTLDNSYSNLEKLEHSIHSKISNTGRIIDVVRDEKGRYVKKENKKKRDSINQGKKVGNNWFVESVEYQDELIDVYDMTVEKYHNFIANDMVVHNCAEEPLPAGGSCLLSSINLSEFVINPFTDKSYFDYEKFQEVIRIAVKAMNDVLDEGLPLHPLQEQRDSVRNWRQIGIGVMGIADMLIKMQLRYGSEESIELCDTIASVLIDKSIYYSSELAKEYGAYPKCNKELLLKNNFLNENVNEETKRNVKKYGLRNSQLLTIAPTGSISTMLGVSGGIEPFFAFHYTRKTESLHGKDVYYEVPTATVYDYMKFKGIEKESELPNFFVASKDIHYTDRIKMQATWQKHIDASISSTVNLPNSTTKEQVFDLYMFAAENKLKGITIYRDGCEREGILKTNSDKTEESDNKPQLDCIIPISRSEIGKTIGTTNKFKTACGNLYITINRDMDGNIVETFVNVSKNGICKSNIDGISRMISLALRSGTTVDEVVDQLKGINCPACTRALSKGEKLDGISCPDIIARTIQNEYDSDEIYIKKTKRGKGKKRQIEKEKPKMNAEDVVLSQCPDCGQQLEFTGGCCVCTNCGYSKCS